MVQIDETAVLEALRRACERSLEQWPAARAALLYGSRARGDFRPGSDWDVMLLTDDADYRDMPDRLPLRGFAAERNTEVNICVYSADRMRRRATLTGSFDRSVARDSVLLAGRWTRPELDRKDGMDIDGWRRHMGGALGKAEMAGDRFVRALNTIDLLAAFDAYVEFMACSADSAEFVAKAALMRRGVTPRKIHDITALANQLQAERPGDAEATALAEKLRRLNGDTKALHVAVYHGDVDLTDGVRAVCRIGLALGLWTDELAAALADGDLRISERAGKLAGTALEQRGFLAALSRKPPDREMHSDIESPGWLADVREMDAEASEIRRHWDVFTERVRALKPEPTPEPSADSPSPF